MTDVQLPTFTIGDRMRKAREFANLSVGQMAEMLRVSRNTISNYEHDHGARGVPWSVIRSYSQITGVPLDWFSAGPETGHTQGSYQSGWIDWSLPFLGRELVLT